MNVVLLGGFDARLGSGAPLKLTTKKAQALVAYLGLRPGQGHPRDKLAALLWGEKSGARARDGLRHALADLRRALAGADPPCLRIDGQIVSLNAAAVHVDVVAFEELVRTATPRALEQAAALYGGDLLYGFTVNEPLFDEWLVAERERLREVALDAMARLLAHQSKAAATERAIQTAVRLLALDPLQEAVHRTLMRLYDRQGRRGAALKQYQACVSVLQRELGTSPEAETRQLYQQLLRHAAEVVTSGRREDDRARPARTAPRAPDLPASETPLVGRAAALGRLRAALDDVIGGHGRLATVVGEAGVGKTRLLSSVAMEALSRGCRVMIGHCHESDTILPFGPWVDAFRAGEVSTDPEILDALHPARRAELARLLPEAAAAGAPPATEGALALFEAVVDLVEQVAARQPLVLVLENVHWADEMSLRLLSFLARRTAGWTTLLLATAREEELPEASMARRTLQELNRAPHAAPVTLAPLSRPETAVLVRALTRVGSDAPMLAEVEARIWAMSEGNPFVAVEALRALDSLEHGGTGERALLPLPGRVRDLVARRLDRLGARSQELVGVAAIIGRRVDFALLHRASGMAEREAAEAVEEAVRHHVLQAVGNELDFMHERIREVALGRLLGPRRRVLHRAVTTALEADRPGERIEQLAHHALGGELWDTAVRSLRQAGVKAAARSALHEARTWLDQALGAVSMLPADRSALVEAFEIHLALRPVLTQLGEYRLVLERLREAEALAERLDDDGRRGRVLAFMTNVHCRLDELDEATASAARALEIAARLGDLGLRILASTYLGQAQYYRGEYRSVVDLTTANLAALPPEWVHEFFGGSQPPAINDRFRLIVSLAHLGRFAEATTHEAEAIRLAEPTHHPYTVGVALHGAATLALVKGDWPRARAVTERQIAVLRAGNIAGELPTALASSARALAYLGDASEALRLSVETERLLDGARTRARGGSGWIYYSLGRAYLTLGRLDDARRLSTLALAPSGRSDFLPDALHLLADVAAHPAGLDGASSEGAYRKAMAMAELRGMHPLVAHCHLGLATLYARTRRRALAREHFETAATFYRAMDMPFWLAQAEAAR